MIVRKSASIRVVPSASRLINSLRDLGYDFPQAVADLVDNSITAGATRVGVDLCFEGPDSWLRITDNGHGMTADAITEAMRYGSQQSYEEEDLGKFGLGLKTASLSQCRRLSVASCSNAQTGRIVARLLDLDHVVDSNEWDIFALSAKERDVRLVDSIRKHTGTVVLWESLDRVLGYKIPWGSRAKAAVDRLSDQLSLHLGMVFHRFIEGSIEGRKRVQVRVNGKPIAAWDPFALAETNTRVLPSCELDVAVPEGFGLVRFQPYVLPTREAFSSEEAFHLHAGPRKWNAQQGLYIYRANRMIQSGGWSRLRALDEHVKLARASLDFYPELDHAFEINVAKVRAVLPADLRDKLQGPVEALVRGAQSAYREGGRSEAALDAKKFERGTIRAVGALTRPALKEAAEATGDAAALRRILREVKRVDTRVARLLGY